MNSTERNEEMRLRAFYQQHLIPLAVQLRRQGKTLLPTQPDRSSDSYYAEREGCVSYVTEISDIDTELRRIWATDPEFGALIEPLLQLAHELEITEERSGDVSPFVYAMF